MLGAPEYIPDYSSNVETSNNTVVSASRSVDLLPGAEVILEGDILTIIVDS
ncbi:MAG: hypothetical protein ACOCYU_00130 [Brevefilum sp.]